MAEPPQNGQDIHGTTECLQVLAPPAPLSLPAPLLGRSLFRCPPPHHAPFPARLHPDDECAEVQTRPRPQAPLWQQASEGSVDSDLASESTEVSTQPSLPSSRKCFEPLDPPLWISRFRSFGDPAVRTVRTLPSPSLSPGFLLVCYAQDDGSVTRNYYSRSEFKESGAFSVRPLKFCCPLQ